MKDRMTIRYLDHLERLEFEIRQLREEGLETSEAEKAFSAIMNMSDPYEKSDAALSELLKLQVLYSGDTEPETLEEIRERCQPGTALPAWSGDHTELLNRILGGWLGRAAGCLLGKPVEKYSREEIREILESNGEWPLNNYFTDRGVPESIHLKYPWKRRGGWESLRENIVCMPEDDDLNYTMINLAALESAGPSIRSKDIAETWLARLPVLETFTAERIAVQNLLNGIAPPMSGRHLNPFREWIGAQIRADLWGYVCPGDPEKASDLAWRDAVISHTGNAVYGEMYIAALIAAAFTADSVGQAIETALGYVPTDSRIYRAIKRTLDIAEQNRTWEETMDTLQEEFGHYHWVHSINNACLTTASLLFSCGDYETGICSAVSGGWDTDCNGATVGSVIGVFMGADSLPEKWITPLKNRVRSSVKGFDNAEFTDLAKRTAAIRTKGSVDGQKMKRDDDF